MVNTPSPEKMEWLQRKFQEHLSGIHVTGAAGGGGVKIEMDGTHYVRRVSIDPDFLSKKDWEVLEDLVRVAINDANHKVMESLRTQAPDFLKDLDDLE